MKKSLTIDKVPFTQIANSVLNNNNLSFKAKGLFAYLYSKPESYDFSNKRILKDSTDGRDSVLAGLRELEDCGYLVRVKQNSGRVAYLLTFKPDPENPDLAVNSPDPENPKVGKSVGGKIPTISNTDTTQSNIDKNSNTDLQPPVAEEIIEVLEKFKTTINPTLNYGNKTQRRATQELLELMGKEKLVKMVEYAIFVSSDRFAPTITTPYQLKEKMGQLIAYYNKQQNKTLNILTV